MKKTTVFFFIAVLAATFFVAPISSLAAEKSSKLTNVEILEPDTVYTYDLNGDGQAESIRFKLIENEEAHTATLKLYINKKLYLKKTDNGLSFRVSILDLDQGDAYLDFFIHTVSENDCASNAFFAQYNEEKKFHTTPIEFEKVAKNLSVFRYSLKKIDGKGKFTLSIDTPVYSPSIGCYYCYVSFQMKDGKITKLPASTYSLLKFSKEYQYKTVKAFSAYKTAGSKTVAYKVKKGDTVTFDKMHLSKTGKVYFRVINSKGKKGWISSNTQNLFQEIPQWG